MKPSSSKPFRWERGETVRLLGVTISVLKPTVLILGAGASAPFGFLSGRNLLFNLMEDLAQTTSVSFANLRELGHSDYQISLFQRELLNSMRASVDAFLESKPEYLTMGKAAIAASLIPYEREDRLPSQRCASYHL